MIETLKQSHGAAYGFNVVGNLTAGDVAELATSIDAVIAANGGKPIGLLADLTQMEGATWSARWDEMHFLRHHSNFIARMAVISDIDWQQVAEMVVNTAGGIQAETRYFHSAEIAHAWHWVKMGPHDEGMPVRIMYPGTGLFADYTPEYVGI
jgi:hypothetical protein